MCSEVCNMKQSSPSFPKPMSIPPSPPLSSCKEKRNRAKNCTVNNVGFELMRILQLLCLIVALVLLFSDAACGRYHRHKGKKHTDPRTTRKVLDPNSVTEVAIKRARLPDSKKLNYHIVADVAIKANISECPPGFEINCGSVSCNRTCEDAVLLGKCEVNSFICEPSDYVCECFNSWGYYRRNANTTECIRKNHPDCKAAREISCDENEQAMCKGYADDENCLARTCTNYNVNQTAIKPMCVWSEEDEDLYCAKKSQLCVCSNGYVYDDIRQKKCVQPEDCRPTKSETKSCGENEQIVCETSESDKNCSARTCDNYFKNKKDDYQMCVWSQDDDLNCESDEQKCVCSNGYVEQNHESQQNRCIRGELCNVCGENKQAVCPYPGWNNCLKKTCVNYYVNRTEMCIWPEEYCPYYKHLRKYSRCECANGYVYDVPQNKCVIAEDCRPFWWKQYGKYRDIHEWQYQAKHVMVTAGDHFNGGQVIVMRFNDTAGTFAGKLVFRDGPFYVWAGAVDTDKRKNRWLYPINPKLWDMEILYALPGAIQWLPHTKNDDGSVPKTALKAGSLNNVPQYIGRGKVNHYNEVHFYSGRIENGKLYIPTFVDLVDTVVDYEVLCINPNYPDNPNVDDDVSSDSE